MMIDWIVFYILGLASGAAIVLLWAAAESSREE